MGLADIALYEGRTQDAIAILQEGIAADIAERNNEAAARKTTMLAEAHLDLKKSAAALSDAQQALRLSEGDPIIELLAGETYAQAGRFERVLSLASRLDDELVPEYQSYGTLLRGEVYLQRGDWRLCLANCNFASQRACHNVTSPRRMLFISKALVILAKHSRKHPCNNALRSLYLVDFKFGQSFSGATIPSVSFRRNSSEFRERQYSSRVSQRRLQLVRGSALLLRLP